MSDPEFLEEIISGLSSNPKSLNSKYFYDQEGSRLFQKIMQLPEYYLTRSEMEIFQFSSSNIWERLEKLYPEKKINLIDLGSGDGIKTANFLESGVQTSWDITYSPIDLSASVFDSLIQNVPDGLKLHTFHADYSEGLPKAVSKEMPNLVLFLGSNIGNMTFAKSLEFISFISSHLSLNDTLLLGADMIKAPSVIIPAYNDPQGVTRDFNFNLLHRINRELGGDFKIQQFEHFPTYDIHTGEMRSYLVSLKEQVVYIEKAKQSFYFEPYEYIFTEISKKFSQKNLKEMGGHASFHLSEIFYDQKQYFAEVLFIKE